MNAVPSRGRMKADGTRDEVATVGNNDLEGSSVFARLVGLGEQKDCRQSSQLCCFWKANWAVAKLLDAVDGTAKQISCCR
jgi:hypothetical protein